MYAYKSKKDKGSPKCNQKNLSPLLDSACCTHPSGESSGVAGSGLFTFYMSKDPAVLFYTADFLTGTLTMSNEHVGMYIRLLCLQHQKGKLTKNDMSYICKTYVEDVYTKFDLNKDGCFYNKRLQAEALKRKDYSESRRKNVSKRYSNSTNKSYICKTYVEHMENENENEDINNKEKEIVKRKGFEVFWIAYPRKIAKKKAFEVFSRIKPSEEKLATILSALEEQKSSDQWIKDKGNFIPYPATWLNQERWNDENEQCEDPIKAIRRIAAEGRRIDSESRKQ